MRRFCTVAGLVGSLLVTVVPAQASSANNHRQKSHDSVRAHSTTSATSRAHKLTYGRT